MFNSRISITTLLLLMAGLPLFLPSVSSADWNDLEPYLEWGSHFNADAEDLTGRNNGTGTGTPFGGTDMNGNVNQALGTSGSNYVTIADSPSVSYKGDMTISVWIYPTSVPSFTNILAKANVGVGGWAMAQYSGNLITIDQVGANPDSTTSITNNAWQHIVFVFNSSGRFQTFKNMTVFQSASDANGADISNDLFIGRREDNNNPFYGTIDELLIFNKSLTGEEVQFLFDNYDNYTVPAADVPISNSSWNVTSGNVIDDNTIAWNTGGLINISSNTLSFTVAASENTNMSCSIGNDLNYTSMVALSNDYKSATTGTTSHSYLVADDISLDEECLYCSFIRSDGTGELADSSSGCLRAVRYDIPASINGVIFPSINFSFASTSYATAQFETFNTSIQQNFTILSAMNIEKATSPPSTRIVTGRILVDGVERRVENLRTVGPVGETGSAGFSPTLVNIAPGPHNITVQFRSSGSGSINIDNLDTMLLFAEDPDDNHIVRMNTADFKGWHLSNGETVVAEWDLEKYIFSRSFIVQRILASKDLAGDTNITYYNKDIVDNQTSPLFERSISVDTIGSMEVSWIESAHNLNHTQDIFGIADSNVLVNVSINGSAFNMDDRDSANHLIQSKYIQDPNTNRTLRRTITSSSNIVNDSIKMIDGDSLFMTFSISIASLTDDQEITITIGDTNCRNQKQRSFSETSEVGNIFLYAFCSGYSKGQNISLSADIELQAGESVEILDESLVAGEARLLNISQLPSPPAPNEITNPQDGDTVAGFDSIDWLFFSDPDNDITGYEVKLQQLAVEEEFIDAVGIWRFEENGGTICFDNTTFTPNNGAHNGTPIYAASKGGNRTGSYALDFDGSTEHINFGDIHDLRDHDLSVCAWINADNTAPAATNFAVTKADTTGLDGRWGFGLLNSGVIRVLYDAGASQAFSGATSITTNWHHVCVVYDRDDVVSLYLDKNLDGQSGDISGSAAIDLNTDRPLMVAADNDAAGQATLWWDGQIDEVMIFNRSLSQADINDIYREGYLQTGGIVYSLANISSTTNSIDVNYSLYNQEDYRINVTATDGASLTAFSFVDITIGFPLFDVLLISPENGSMLTETNITFLYNVTRNSDCNLFINNTLNTTGAAFTTKVNQFSTSSSKNASFLWNITCSDDFDFSGESETWEFTTMITKDTGEGLISFVFAECPSTSLSLTLFIFIFIIAAILAAVGYYFNLGLMTFSGGLILFMQSISLMYCHFLIGGVFFGMTSVTLIWGGYLIMTGRF